MSAEGALPESGLGVRSLWPAFIQGSIRIPLYNVSVRFSVGPLDNPQFTGLIHREG
jgi:hypothetical protein